MLRTTYVSMVLTCALVPAAAPVRAAGTPEQACQNGRYAAAAKYDACEEKAMGRYYGGGLLPFGSLSKCRVKYTAAWAKLQAKAAGTGSSCDAARFSASGGTVTDNLTGLQWEQKTDDSSVHDKDNFYTWSIGGPGSSTATGTLFTSFLPALDSGTCFAGQCDWRLPTRAELLTILSEPWPCTTSPCIDQGVFGPTIVTDYCTISSDTLDPTHAWRVAFDFGTVVSNPKFASCYVRAVRGGL